VTFTAADGPSTGGVPHRVLVVHPAMAPYRTDLFNLLARRLTLRVLFLKAVPPYDTNLRRDDLAASLECDYRVVADRCRRPASGLPVHLPREVADFRPDALVTHEFGWASGLSTMTPLVGRQAARVLWTTRSTDQFDRLTGLRRMAVRLMAPRADALLAYSAASRVRLAAVAGVSESSIFVCANHQDAARLRRLADEGRAAVAARCRQAGLLDRPLVVTVGRLVAVKDIATTIRGFAAASDATRDAALVIVGDGPLRPDLEQVAREAGVDGRVVFVGHVSTAETQAWLAAASITVLASLAEPFGAVVAEGLSHGAPCLCSTAAGAAVLIDEPARGATFPPGDVAAVASALRDHAGGFRPASDLVASDRPDLRPLTVVDDANGFCAAIAHAVVARGRRSAS
jgi:glycosyltransferase involved in cell wall biosynthesis